MEKFMSLRGRAFLFLLFLTSLWFLNFVGRTLFAPVLPIIEDEFLITHAKASSIFIFQSVGYAISIFFSGLLSGRVGYKKSIAASLILSALVFFLIPFSRSFTVLYGFSFVIGVATGVYMPAVIPLITRYYDERLWGRSIGIHDSAASIAVCGTPLIALFLLKFFPWRGMFAVVGVVFVIAAVSFYLLCEELKVGKIDRAAFGAFITGRSLWLLSIVWVFAASTSLGVYSVIPLYLTKELHMDMAYANTIFGFSRLGGFAVAVGSGYLTSRFSLRGTHGLHPYRIGNLHPFRGPLGAGAHASRPFPSGELRLRLLPCRPHGDLRHVPSLREGHCHRIHLRLRGHFRLGSDALPARPLR